MRAALCTQAGEKLEIADIAVSSPGPREVLIRTRAVGLCRSDLNFIDGPFPHDLPFVPGHEASGVVEAVGNAVTRLKAGDHVITSLTAFCGVCEHCTGGNLSLCQEPALKRNIDETPRLSRNGQTVHHYLNLSAFAEQMLVHENACVAIHPDMPFAPAALIGCAVTTGACAVFRDSDLRPGETIAIIGCGGIGLAAVNAARIAGAGRIIAIDPLPHKLALAHDLGATDCIEAGRTDMAETIIAMTQGGAHKVIEAAGKSQTVQLGWDITRRGGTVTVLGMVSPHDPVTLSGPSFLQGKKLQGSLMGSTRSPVDIPRLVDFYLNGQLELDRLIAHSIPLEDINIGLDRLRKGDELRTVITFDD